MREEIVRWLRKKLSDGSVKKPCNLEKSVLSLLSRLWVSHRRQVYQKGVNKSNEGRNPSQLSADYDQMRLR